LAKGGRDFRKDRIEYNVRISDLGPGGIRADRVGRTNIPGLYAAGAASDHGEDGVSNVITHGMESAIGGYRAGHAAAKFAYNKEESRIDDSQLKGFIQHIYEPMGKAKGMRHQEVRQKIKKMGEDGLVGAVRNANRLKNAIEIIEQIKGMLPDLIAQDSHDLTRALGLNNEVLFVELLAKCALHRTESRGSHYREDYPGRDDDNWLKWVIAKKVGEDIKIWDESPSTL
jgi:succinate dehydrogenase/fumarate reductase flavoprotein subunit